MAISSSTSTTVLERLSDRYEILQPIGRSFGYQQFLAKDLHQKRPVIIKSLPIEDNTPTGDICCFEREIQLLESLNHPTIPSFIDSFTVNATHEGQTRKGLVLVQDQMGTRTLAQEVAAKIAYTEADLKLIAKQLLQGLIYLHSKGLVHRDIKPENVAITTHSGPGKAAPTIQQVSWLNLGTVQYVQAQRNDALVGTYGYMPPEQVGGQATFASDLYSLGATLIYLVTGRHLGEMPHRPAGGGLKAQFSCMPSRLSPDFQQWLNWLIEPCVAGRPVSAKQALRALNHLPLAMLKRRIVRPAQAMMLPVPILNGRRDKYEPFFTQIKSIKKLRSFELVVPAVGLKPVHVKRSLPPLMMGGALLSVAAHLFSLLEFSPAMFATVGGAMSGVASVAAAGLGLLGCYYGAVFLRNGFRVLSTALFRQVRIQMEADVLLVAYKDWLRSPVYVVNTRREDIYSICTLPDNEIDAGALRILTHRNRTQRSKGCYKLTVADGALTQRDLRWVASLLNDWRNM